ncbi:hypothetical protein QTJ16_000202 [Diplocarpon rosae]|uniref:Kinesin light chain n=1 Tax=Diplocarpon rosae TaxID=946125 RepID=A0AAD9T5H6_9HELO|nr:hypothetical protein QTJ16_000202 [Diplocarpon rosae]PBP26261.1 hypothetical protein BUE80_DR002884 [Diplocarpon rosae]
MAAEDIAETLPEASSLVEPEGDSSAEFVTKSASVSKPPPEAPSNSFNLIDELSEKPAVDGVIGATVQAQLSDVVSRIILTSFDAASKTLATRHGSIKREETAKVDEREERSPDDPTPFLPTPPFKMPHSRNPDFVGRTTALSRLFGMWNPGQKSRARIAIVGLGGVGKTELAVEFVHRVREISPTTPLCWFGPEDINPSDGQISAASPGTGLEQWLATEWHSDTILVVDSGDCFEVLQENIANRGRLVDKLKSFKGTMLLLTRNTQNASELTGSHGMCEVGELEVDASVLLFRSHHNLDASLATEADIQGVVRSMAYLPRAIIQAAGVVSRTGMKVSQFYEMYQREDQFKLRLLGRIDPISSPEYDVSVIGRGVFDVQKFRARYHKFSRFLYQLYFLGGNTVPWKIFSSDDPLDMVITMVLLKGNFLIAEDSTQHTYTLHPLVYLAIRNSLGSDRSEEADTSEERKWYEDIVLAFSREYPDSTQDSRAWWKTCFAHLVGGYALHNEPLQVAVASVYYRESTFFKRKGMYIEALGMIELAQNVLPDPTPPQQLAIVQEHVSLLYLLARYREMHEVLQRTSPEPGTGILWKRRMQAKLEQADCANQYESAIEIFTQIQLTVEASNGPETLISVSMDDLGMASMDKGLYREATAACLKALAERKASLGSSCPDTLTSCYHLAEILKRKGQYSEALRYIQGALDGMESLLGQNHPETVQSRVVKASILRCKAVSINDYDEAENLLLGCIDRLGAALSTSHPLVAASRSELALIFLARGNYEMAEQMNRSVLTTSEGGPWLDPSTHPDTLRSKYQLVEVLRLKDGCKTVDILSEQVLSDRTASLTSGTLAGSDFHPDQLASLHQRAIILSGLQQHLPALQKIELALSGRKSLLGDDHPDVFMSMTWKGEILRAQLPRYQAERAQTLDAIESLHKEAYEGLSLIFGPEHQNTLQCATNLALLKDERGVSSKSEAEGLYRQIFKSCQRTLGDLHPETLKSRGRYAEAIRASSVGNHSRAKRLWRESCSGFAKVYGPDAYVTAKAYKEYEKFLQTYPDP